MRQNKEANVIDITEILEFRKEVRAQKKKELDKRPKFDKLFHSELTHSRVREAIEMIKSMNKEMLNWK